MNQPPLPDHKNLLKQIHQGLDLLAKNQKEKTLEIFDTLPRQLPDDEELLQAMGVLAFNLGQHAIAIQFLSRLVAIAPDNITSLDQLAIAYIGSGRLAEARHLLQRVLAINPDASDSLINLGKIYLDVQDYTAAVNVLERARIHVPEDPTLLTNLSVAYNHLGFPEKALECALKAKRNAPNAHSVNRMIGALKLQLGEPREAIKYYKQEISLNKFAGQCYWGIAAAQKNTAADEPFLQQMENLLKESMPAIERGFIHFAAAKMCDDLKRWDQAFEHYRMGNLLRKASTPPIAPKKFIRRVQKSCTPKLARIDTLFGSDSTAPIFVLGMPRTGSTLTEQILSSHPDVKSAGEMPAMNQITEQIFSPDNKPQALIEKALTKKSLEEHAAQYLNILRSNGRENAKYIIDKSPGNFHYIGFILLMFPNARFIHTIRHPLDTLLSCYFQPFGAIPWAQDLGWQAESYCLYRKIIAYWQRVLPPDRILDVHYEQLIAEPELESRRIMAYCGLDWRPECLEFFKQEGSVRTASTWQVRQPIYQSSKMRWVHYASHLEALAQGIRPYLAPSDITILNENGVKVKPLGSLGALKHRLFN